MKKNALVIFILAIISCTLLIAHQVIGQEQKNAGGDNPQKVWLDNYHKEYGKIRDPYHPWFNPDKFQFEDYTMSYCTRQDVLAKLFPVGTPKQFVDRVLVKAGGATSTASTQIKNKYNYFKDLSSGSLLFMSATWNVAVEYDETEKVTDIKIQDQSVYDVLKNCKPGHGYGKGWY